MGPPVARLAPFSENRIRRPPAVAGADAVPVVPGCGHSSRPHSQSIPLFIKCHCRQDNHIQCPQGAPTVAQGRFLNAVGIGPHGVVVVPETKLQIAGSQGVDKRQVGGGLLKRGGAGRAAHPARRHWAGRWPRGGPGGVVWPGPGRCRSGHWRGGAGRCSERGGAVGTGDAIAGVVVCRWFSRQASGIRRQAIIKGASRPAAVGLTLEPKVQGGGSIALRLSAQ